MLSKLLCRALHLLLLATAVLAAQDFYKELGVDRQANDATIKKAYRKIAKANHPDKNKDPAAQQKFADASNAYEVLMDSEKRQIYDHYGEDGLKQRQNNGGRDPRDVFSRFFGGGGGGQEERRGPSKLTEIEVDLADFYNGREVEFELDKMILCDHCRGSGAASDGDVVKCGGCGGHGVKMQKTQVFPGMYTQMQVTCNECSGKGTRIRRPCPHCHAQKILPSKVQLSYHLPAGAPDGFEIVFDGDADESPDWEAGDVIVRTRSRKTEGNGGWGRKGQSLVWRKTIGVEDALLGINASLTHLDGHAVDLSRSGVTQPGHVHQIPGEGMPAYGDSDAGDLFVHYDVVLPSSLTHALRKDLEEAFAKARGGRRRDEL